MKPPDLSIVIINWRLAPEVRGALSSIMTHEHRCSIEVIVVNKASEDRCEEMLAAKFPSVRHVPFPTFGIAVMRNAGIEASHGRHVVMLDSDTELLPGALDGLVRFMDRNPRLGGCGGRTVRMDGSFEHNVKRFYNLPTIIMRRTPLGRLWPDNPWDHRHLMKDKDPGRPYFGDWMAGACFCMRREAIEDVGLFDDSYYFGFEDVDWCWRARHRGWRIAYNPYAPIIHKVRRASAKGVNRLAWEHLLSGLRFWWKTRTRR